MKSNTEYGFIDTFLYDCEEYRKLMEGALVMQEQLEEWKSRIEDIDNLIERGRHKIR